MFKRILNKIIRKLTCYNSWYQQKFGDVKRIKGQLVFNLDVLNTGSNSAYYAFDYTSVQVKGANLAMRPQSLPQDLNMMKMYESYLRPRGTILVPLCPFSSCYKTYSPNDKERYYGVWHPGLIEDFNLEECEKYWQIMNSPLKMAPVPMIKGFIHSIINFILCKKEKIKHTSQPMSVRQLEADAEYWVEGWKKLFKIDDLDCEMPSHILEGRAKRIKTLKEIVEFCKEREFKLVFVMPPVTKYLSSKFSKKFRKNYIYSFLEESGAKDICFLNYFDDEDLMDSNLYFNSFFLNKKGRRVFTERVMRDVEEISVKTM